MKLLPLAARNLARNWRRTAVTTLAMAFAGALMILYAALMEGLLYASERNAVGMTLGDIQIHANGYRSDPDLYTRVDNPAPLIATLEQADFHVAPRLYGFGLAAVGVASAGIQLRGIALAAERRVTRLHEHVLQGRWLRPADGNGAVIGRKLARSLGVEPGDEVVVVSQAADGSMADALFQVRGILKSVAEDVDRSGFYILDRAFREFFALPEGAHELALRRGDEFTDLDAATARAAALAPGLETLNWRELRPVVARILDSASTQLLFALLITYLAVAMVVLNAMLMSVFERIQELGVMKALGMSPWQVGRLIGLEALIQALVAVILALLAGTALAQYFARYGIDLSGIAGSTSFAGIAIDPIWHARLTEFALLTPLGFLLLISTLAVIYPAFKAALIRPVTAITHHG